jgi:EAL domain-containing protein (putative c-di-GMP-specific phosphodiesterase class I)
LIFQEDLQLSKQYERNINIANEIKSALQEDRIVPYFQPIYDTQTQKVVKYEVLVRLIQKDGKVLSPFHFLEVSEKIKLYSKITEVMIRKTFAYFAHNGLSFSLNLSFSDMLNEKTRNYLFEKMQEYNIASQLTIEILETQEYQEDKIITKFIEEVYAHGANIAIDDFGSGYANFEHITTIKSDYIKIDGSLIKKIDSDKNTRLIVETIVSFAKKLNKKIVAEFVHNKEVYIIVKSLGIDWVQGYYFSEPLAEVLES